MATKGDKRRRIAGNALHITDLPVGILVDAAAYIVTPSRALFAAAIGAPSPSWQNDKVHQQPSVTSRARRNLILRILRNLL